MVARFPFSAVHNIKRADTIKKHRRFPPEAAVFSSLLLFGEQLAERLAGFNRLGNFNSFGKLYRVMIQADPKMREDLKSMNNVYAVSYTHLDVYKRQDNGDVQP